MTGLRYGGTNGATWGGSNGATWGVDPAEFPAGKQWAIDGYPTEGLVGTHPALILTEDATFTLKFDPETQLDSYEHVRDLGRIAGPGVVWQPLGGGVRIREQNTQELSLIVPIEPGPETNNTRGIWGLVRGYDDSTRVPTKHAVASVTVTYLADLADYGSVHDLKAALEE